MAMSSRNKLSATNIEEDIFMFHPPDARWQYDKAKELNLKIENLLWHTKPPWYFVKVETPPKFCEQVVEDGNSLFRSLSFWIASSENQHLVMREAVVRELERNPDVYLPLTKHPTVDSYIRETGMDQEGVKGTEVEIFIAATILNTPIAVFAAFGDKPEWQIFKPLDIPANRDRLNRHPNTKLYLQLRGSNYELVIDI